MYFTALSLSIVLLLAGIYRNSVGSLVIGAQYPEVIHPIGFEWHLQSVYKSPDLDSSMVVNEQAAMPPSHPGLLADYQSGNKCLLK